MQRSLLTSRDRAGAVIGVALVHGAIVLAVLIVGGGEDRLNPAASPPMEVFDVTLPPPPVVEIEQVKEARTPEEEGAASAPNIRSQATPVIAPEPGVPITREAPVAAATPNEGTDPTQGAAPVAGPGTGAGGTGTGTGSGGSGSGTGGGLGGQEPRGPSVIPSTTLTGRDYPREVIRAWPRRAPVFVAVRVQLDGRATDCKVNRSSGDPVVDQWTCRLVENQVRFRPAINERGQPYVAWYGYVQRPVNF